MRIIIRSRLLNRVLAQVAVPTSLPPDGGCAQVARVARSAIRNMERAGIPRSVAMAISGHRTESVYKRYDIVADTDLRKAAERLAEYHAEQPAKLERVK